jgi:general stress protein CsbA
LEGSQQLNAPKVITFWIAVVLAVICVLASFIPSLELVGSAFWLVVIGFVILAAGNLFEGL